MAFKTEVRRFISVLLFFVGTVFGYYCDNDRCSEEEYCCGENMCCKSYKVWDLWYLWFGVSFFICLTAVCTCLWRCGFFRHGPISINHAYSPLQKIDAESASQASLRIGPFHYQHSNHRGYTAPLGAPPPYNQLSASAVKTGNPPPSYAQVIGMGHNR